MGEYVYTTFRVGGRITGRQARDLLDLAEDYRLSLDLNGGELRVEDIGKEWCGEVNYGNLDALTDLCAAQGIDYDYFYDSGPEWDPHRTKVIDGVAVEFKESEEGAVVPIDDLIRLDALATGWADFHAKIKLWARELPPVQIVGEVPDA